MTRYLPHAFVSLVFVFVYAFLYFSASPIFADPDVAWHLAAGDAIRATGALPVTDTWSFTVEGRQPWYIISWLWDVKLSMVEHLFGLKGVYVCTQAITALILALLAQSLIRRGGIGGDALIFTLFLAGLSFIEFSAPRPQLAAYFCAVLFHRFLHESRGDTNLRRLLWLPLLMVLWVNTHGSFLIGFVLIGIYGLEALIAKQWPRFRQLFITGLCCTAALLINPYGIGMFTGVMRTLHSVTTGFIAEWLPLVFGNSIGISAWLILFILASGFRERSIPLADKIISIAWAVFALASIRTAAFFILLSAPFMAISLQRFLEQLESIRTRRTDIKLALEKHGMPLKMAILAVAVVIGSYAGIDALRGKTYINSPALDAVAAIDWMKHHASGKRILNDYNFGGRIVYETNGTFPVFIDSRAGSAYPEELLNDYMSFLYLEKGWDSAVAKYHLDGIMVGNTQRFARAYADGAYRDQWKQVYHDDVASIYFRK